MPAISRTPAIISTAEDCKAWADEEHFEVVGEARALHNHIVIALGIQPGLEDAKRARQEELRDFLDAWFRREVAANPELAFRQFDDSDE